MTTTIPTPTLGQEIRRAREDAGLDQDELAERVGYSRSYVSKWEKGTRRPNVTQLQRIMKALDAPWLAKRARAAVKAELSETERHAELLREFLADTDRYARAA